MCLVNLLLILREVRYIFVGYEIQFNVNNKFNKYNLGKLSNFSLSVSIGLLYNFESVKIY